MRWRRVVGFAAAVPVLGLVVGGLAGAPVADCRDRRFHWSDDAPPINLRHVFCGEIDDGKPKGLHARRLAATSPVVAAIEPRRDEGGGIYSAVVTFTNGRRKLSTFFPDACSTEQITRSIAHAADNVLRRHPAWGEIGLSAPAAGAETFCLDKNGSPFEIRFGVLANGRINTAFPN